MRSSQSLLRLFSGSITPSVDTYDWGGVFLPLQSLIITCNSADPTTALVKSWNSYTWLRFPKPLSFTRNWLAWRYPLSFSNNDLGKGLPSEYATLMQKWLCESSRCFFSSYRNVEKADRFAIEREWKHAKIQLQTSMSDVHDSLEF